MHMCTCVRTYINAPFLRSAAKCYQAFHPTCGRMAGLHMEMVENPFDASSVEYMTFCPRHCEAQPEVSGIKPLREGQARPHEAAAREAARHKHTAPTLWNAQPYLQPPALLVPDPAGGCARATMVSLSHWRALMVRSTV